MAGQAERVRRYYDERGESEWHRLALPFEGAVEREIHRRALEALLPARARVLDLGGGPGRWTIWLARRGHRVVLADLSPVQLEIARREIAKAGVAVEGVLEADARDLSRLPTGGFDALLSLGPFYHLTDAAGRRRALAEARRVLRPGGVIFAAVMARHAWLLGVVLDHGSRGLAAVRRALATGVFRAPAEGALTEAYLFRPEAVAPFFESAGFRTLRLLASQGVLALVQERVAELAERDPAAHAALLDMAWEASGEPSVLGLSTHLLYVGEAC